MSLKTFLYNFQLGFRSIPLTKLQSKYCDVDSRFIQIDGLKVHYKDQGEGPVLLLLHGVVASLHTWDSWHEELKDHYRIIRLDLPGWGITGPSKDKDYLGGPIVDFLEKFTKAIGVDNFYLAGNSLGAYYAWSYSVVHPEKVKKLILHDPIAYNQSLPYVFALSKIPGVSFLIANIVFPRFFIQDSLKRLYGRKDRLTEKIYNIYWELIMRKGNRETLAKGFRMIAELSKSDTVYLDVKKIKMPVLLTWGKQDVWSRWKETLDCWIRDLPHAELIIYDECGHMPMEEIPVETSRDAHEFILKSVKNQKRKKKLA